MMVIASKDDLWKKESKKNKERRLRRPLIEKISSGKMMKKCCFGVRR